MVRITKRSKLVAGVLTGVLLVAGFGGAAIAAPSDVSEARGQFLRTNVPVLGGILAANGAQAEYPSGVFPVANEPLVGSVLQQIVGQLEGSSAIGTSGVLTLGAASQYAQALPDGTARAGSGAVTSVNGLVLGGTGAPGANASLNLTPLISRAGASAALSQAQLQLGALGSTIESRGGTVTSDYLIGDANLTLTSPLVSGVYNQLRGQVGQVQSAVDNLEVTARANILNYLNGLNAQVLRADATVSVTEPNLSALLPTGAVGSGTGVSVNLSTGQVVVDLKTLLASNPDLPDINDLPANTTLLSGPIGTAITQGIVTAVTAQVDTTLTNVRTAVEATRLVADVQLQGRSLLGGSWQSLVGLRLDAPLSSINSGSAQFALTGAVPGLLNTVLGVIGINLNQLLTGALNEVLALVRGVFGTLSAAETTVRGTLAALTGDVAGPVLTALRSVVDLTANVQPSVGDLGNGSSTVRALDVSLLGGAVRLDVASSTVRGTTPDYQPSLSLSPVSVPAGGTTTVTGSGWAPLETVTLTGAGTTRTVTADASGSFTTTLTVPPGTGGGTYALRGAGALSVASTTSELRVTTPSISATTPVYRGASATITGSGFLPGETVTLTRGESAAGTTVANGSGAISATVAIPNGAATGATTISARGATSAATATTTTTVLAYDPAISATPSAVQAGASTTVSGLGFAPNETVALTWAGTGTTTQASASGRISATITVPNGRAAGPLEIAALGETSNTARTATVTVLPYTPSIAVDPAVVEQGSSTVVSGSGFAAGEAVEVGFDGTSRQVFADASGAFSFALPVADDATVGSGTVTALGAVSGAPVEAALAVVTGEYTTELALDDPVVDPGGSTTARGTGFEPGESGAVTVAGLTVPFTADGDGGFAVAIEVPATATPGTYTAIAVGDVSQTPAATELTIDGFAPVIAADPGTLYPGQQTTITGSGFPAGADVAVDFAGAGPALSATADGDGGVLLTYTVPDGRAAGPIAVTATTDAPASTAATELTVVAYAPALSLSPTSGPAGTEVGLVGVGFAPGEDVTVTFPGVELDLVADADGEIDGGFVVPAGAPLGADAVTATGAVSGVPATSTFTVDPTVYTPSLGVDPASVVAGEQTVVSGAGFAPGEVVDVDIAGVSVSPTADGQGAFSTTYTVPASTTPQSYTVTAEGRDSRTPTTAVLDVEPIVYTTAITATPRNITAGGTTTITGTGFAAGETVTVTGAGASGETVADGGGGITVDLTVPAAAVPAGYTVTAVGSTSAAPASTGLTVEPIVYATALALDPDTVLDGGTTIVRGTGFAPDEAIVLDAPGGTIDLTADDAGGFEAPVTVPVGTAAGEYPVGAVGAVSATPATVDLAVENEVFTTTVTATPNPVLPGGLLAVSGAGFAAGEEVTVTFAGASTTATADDDGAFEVSLAVPAGTAAADYQVVATGADSGIPASSAVAVAPVYTPFIALDPASIGQTGSTTIRGSGFAPGETVAIAVDGEPLDTVEAGEDGSFSLAYAPESGAPIGSSTVTAIGDETGDEVSATLSIVSGDYTTAIGSAPAQQLAGQPVTISGTGFAADEEVTVALGTAVTTTTASADGAIETTIAVPADAAPGALAATATGAVSQTPATATVTVVAAPVYAPTLAADPDTADPGEVVIVTGAGFAPRETVVYSFDGRLATVAADDGGAFTVPVTVPTTAEPGALQFQAEGLQSQTLVSATVTVRDADPVYTPIIVPDPATVPQGGTTILRGSGFAPGEDVEVALLGTTRSVEADDRGAFAVDFDVPADQPVGPVPATAVGDRSATSVSATVTITDGAYETSVSAAPDPAAPGSTVTVSGSGFAPLETVDIVVGGTSATAEAAEDGSFEASVVLPASASGTLAVSATGRVSQAPAASTLVVASQPVYFTDIVAEPTSGAPGTAVRVTGAGFAAGETVTLELDGVSFTAIADEDGAIVADLTVPPSAAPGATTITAEGSISATPAAAGFTVLAPQFDPSIAVTPSQVTAGDAVAVSGEGFAPGETITVTLAGASVQTSADPSGAFSTAVTVPIGTAPGSYEASAEGEVSSQPVSQTVVVQAPVYAPSISVSPTSVEAGSDVTVGGIGFAPDESVTVAVGGVEVDVQANGQGAFSTTVTVPADAAPGETPVSARGAVSAAPATTTVVVTSTPPVYAPVIALLPTSAPQGGSTTLSGAGFAPGEVVTVSVFGTAFTVEADEDGGIVETVTVPADAALGAATVTASGSLSATPTSAQLTVTEAPPVQFAPVTTVSPSTAAAGDAVAFAGIGFAPGETVAVTIGGSTFEVQADAAGAFSTPVAIPAGTAPGAVDITAVGDESATPASSTVTVTAPTYAPAIAVAPSAGEPGAGIQVSGSGYAPGDAVVITIGGVEAGTATAGAGGAFSTTVTVPTGAPVGASELVATGAVAGGAASPFTVEPVSYDPFIVADPASVEPGGSTTVRGTGFAPGESVAVELFGAAQSIDADGTGSFAVAFDAPDAPGTFTASAVGSETALPVETAVTVTASGYTTSVAASPDPVIAGGSVTVSGGGYEPGESVTVTLGDESRTVEADGDGGFSTAFAIPVDAAAGTLAVGAVGATSQTPASASVVVQAAPAAPPAVISAAPDEAQQGAPVTVAGSGFGAGETVLVTLAGAETEATASDDGSFSVIVVVPPTAGAGPATATATGSETGRSASVTVQITAAVLAPVISAVPGSAPQGGSIAVGGIGFQPGETVAVSLAGGTPVTGTADGSGRIAVTLPVPLDATPGTAPITATGASSGAVAEGSVTIEVAAAPTYDPSVATGVGPYRPGDTVPVTGVGFAPGETVAIDFAGAAGTAEVGPDGRFTASVTVPADAQPGTLTVTVVGDRSGTASASVPVVAGPSAFDPAVSTVAGPFAPGASVPVSGIGFAPGETVAVSLLGVEVEVVADGNGSFSTSITVPGGAQAGDAVLTAVGAESGEPATAIVPISAAAPVYATAITVAPDEGLPGDQVTITGSGFAPGEIVVVAFAGQRLSATADGAGAFSLRATIPVGSAPGSYQVTAIGEQSQSPAIEAVLVDPVAYDPFLSASPASVTEGGSTTLSGSGYAPGERIDLVLFGEERSVLAAADGTFAADFSVPAGTALGTQTATAVGLTSQEPRTAAVEVVSGAFETAISLAPAAAEPGATVTVEGTGYAPGETVTVTIGSTTVGTGAAAADGSVSIPVVVPAGAPGGPVTVVAVGSESSTPASAALQVLYSPTLIADPVSVEPGAATTLRGAGWAPGERVTLSLFGENRTVTVDAGGAFAAAFTAPDDLVPGTEQTAAAIGSVSGVPRTATVVIVSGDFATAIELAPSSGAPGAPLTVLGTGFAPGETVSVTIGGRPAGSGIAAADGSVAIVATVPTGLPAGTTAVVASGTTSQTPAAVAFDVVYDPFLSASPVAIEQGGVTTLTGSGFAPGENVIVELFDEARVVEADESGGFTADFTAPDDQPLGTATATAEGAVSQTSRTASIEIVEGAFAPEITIVPGSAAPGGTVVIGGSGFQPGEIVTVVIGGQPAGSGAADADGGVTIPVTVPGGLPAGPATVVVVGDVSGTPAGGSLDVVYQPTFTASPLAVRAGDELLLSGSGYAPAEQVVLTVFGQLRTVAAAADGTFSAVFTAPSDLAPGDYEATANGTVSQEPRDALVTVVAAEADTAITVSPGTAAPGASIVVGGTGFAPGETVTVTIGGEQVGTGTAGPDGAVAVTITVPSGLPAGPVQVVAVGDGSGTPAGATLVIAYSPSLTAAPISVVAGAEVTLAGSGWAADETVVLDLFGQTRTVTADADGAFSAVFTAPEGLEAEQLATARGLVSQAERSAAVTVVDGAFAPEVTIEPGTAAPGGTVVVGGSGYQPGETVTVTIGGQPVGSGTVAPDGTVSIPVTVPAGLPAGPNPVVVVGDESAAPAGGELVVAYDPQLRVDPPSILAGGDVVLIGSGYAPGEQVVLSVFGQTRSATASPDGTFAETFTAPVGLAAGEQTATAVGSLSGAIRSVAITITDGGYATAVVVSPGTAAPGDEATVVGSGYAPGETVTVTIGGRPVGGGTASADGTVTIVITVPDGLPAGPVQIVATGAASATPAATTLTIAYAPFLVASPIAAAPGDEVTISGSGYAAGELVTVELFGEVRVVEADADGGFSTVFTVPADAADATATARGAVSQVVRSASITIVDGTSRPVITIDPATAPPGGEVSIGGSGFDPGETVTITIGGETAGTGTVGEDGTFAVVVTVPAGLPAGPAPVVAIGAQSGTPAGGTLVVQPVPQPALVVSPASAAPGASVSIIGVGYVPGELVTVTLDGTAVSAAVIAGPDGTFVVTVTVPADAAAGDYTVTGSAPSGTASAPLVVEDAAPVYDPSIVVAPDEVAAGGTITVTGSGFAPGETVLVEVGTASASVVAGPDGRFSLELELPGGIEPGTYPVTATGAVSGTASATVTVAPEPGIPAYDPVIVASPGTVAPGDEVTVAGTGFAPSEIVTVSLGSVSVQVQAGPDGAFTVAITVPDGTADGDWTILAVGPVAGTASATVAVAAGAEPPAYSPTIEVSPGSASAGSDVTVAGSGFAPGERVTVTVAGQTITVVADADGAFSIVVAIPATAAVGDYTVVAVGDESAIVASAALTVTAPVPGGDGGEGPGGEQPGGEQPGDGEPGAGQPGTGERPGAGQSGGIPGTGAESVGTALLAALLLVGAGVVLGNRRRRSPSGRG